MNQELGQVEDTLRTALREAAEGLRPTARPLLPTERATAIQRDPPHRRHVALVPALVVVAVAAIVISTSVYFSAQRRSTTNAVTGTGPSNPPITSLEPEPAAPSDVGPEIELSRTSNADTDFLLHLAARRGTPMTDPVIVQTPGTSPVIVDNPGCITIAYPGPAGYQGACSPNPLTTLTATNAEAAGPDTEATWYLVWTEVPEGTSYVVYSYLAQLSWQRPIGGVSVFTTVGKAAAPAGDRPFARAYDEDGRQIGEAQTVG